MSVCLIWHGWHLGIVTPSLHHQTTNKFVHNWLKAHQQSVGGEQQVFTSVQVGVVLPFLRIIITTWECLPGTAVPPSIPHPPPPPPHAPSWTIIIHPSWVKAGNLQSPPQMSDVPQAPAWGRLPQIPGKEDLKHTGIPKSVCNCCCLQGSGNKLSQGQGSSKVLSAQGWGSRIITMFNLPSSTTHLPGSGMSGRMFS